MDKRISSSSHEFVKHLVRLQKERFYRHRHQSVLVEGKKTISDLVERHPPLHVVVTENHVDLFRKYPKTIITNSIAKKISTARNPEGCFALFSMSAQTAEKTVTRALVLDRLQDPGNVGTLFRTCLAFGITSIFFIEPCCDPWNPKVLRAAKGAQFDLSFCSLSWFDLPQDIPWFVADLHGENVRSMPIPEKWLLILANEAQGPDVPKVFPVRRVTIPMREEVESMNVAQAGAILLYMFSGGS